VNRDEFETLLGSLAAQYTDACAEELAAIHAEIDRNRQVSDNETWTLYAAYDASLISGKNAEMRKVQCDKTLLSAQGHQQRISDASAAALEHKAATMRRIGIENEIKLWHSWLVSQGGDS